MSVNSLDRLSISKRTYVELRDKNVSDAANDCDEVKHVPPVLEVVLHVHNIHENV